jgi:isocitrate lyase
MVTQNRFKTGLDIAKYTAAIMRKDMAEYDANASNYTHSGSWHGFVAQQNMIAKSIIKRLKVISIYQVGWLLHYVQNLGLPDQSMHENYCSCFNKRNL